MFGKTSFGTHSLYKNIWEITESSVDTITYSEIQKKIIRQNFFLKRHQFYKNNVKVKLSFGKKPKFNLTWEYVKVKISFHLLYVEDTTLIHQITDAFGLNSSNSLKHYWLLFVIIVQYWMFIHPMLMILEHIPIYQQFHAKHFGINVHIEFGGQNTQV